MVDGVFLALDFGGTKHTAAIGQPGAREWLSLRRAYSGPNPNAGQDLDIMFSLARELLGGGSPLGIGVSFGGPVHYDSGVVQLSHHVPNWESTPLQALIETELDGPARVDNDANAAALGELFYGAGRGINSFLYLTISTGVGGGWILNGAPWRGHQRWAGEIGHTVVDPAGPVCLCGKRGCVERLASGPYMAQDLRQALETDPNQGALLRELVKGDLAAIDGQVIAAAAQRGDPLALARLTAGARAVGVGIGNAANLINPQRFILGGGITKSGPLFWDPLREAARGTALPEIQFDILPAALSDEAPLWGALRLAEDAARGRWT